MGPTLKRSGSIKPVFRLATAVPSVCPFKDAEFSLGTNAFGACKSYMEDPEEASETSGVREFKIENRKLIANRTREKAITAVKFLRRLCEIAYIRFGIGILHDSSW
jgi:hypothetical protein